MTRSTRSSSIARSAACAAPTSPVVGERRRAASFVLADQLPIYLGRTAHTSGLDGVDNAQMQWNPAEEIMLNRPTALGVFGRGRAPQKYLAAVASELEFDSALILTTNSRAFEHSDQAVYPENRLANLLKMTRYLEHVPTETIPADFHVEARALADAMVGRSLVICDFSTQDSEFLRAILDAAHDTGRVIMFTSSEVTEEGLPSKRLTEKCAVTAILGGTRPDIETSQLRRAPYRWVEFIPASLDAF